MKKLLFILGLALIAIWFLSQPFPAPAHMTYGVTFSVTYARDILEIDWQKAYLEILDGLGVRHLRIPAYWSEYEPQKGVYDFTGLDFLVHEADKRNADMILAIGEKLPRWPECHVPQWASSETAEGRHADFLAFMKAVVTRYRADKNIRYWQVENEPFLPFFGECKGYDQSFIDTELAALRELDSRPIVVTDSGELSLWARAYARADVFGTTMYRSIWNKYIGRFTYPVRPGFYRMKERMMRMIYGEKPVIVVELQAEPWLLKTPLEIPLADQKNLMNAVEFQNEIDFERQTGISEVYLWGAEWWYWMKEKQNSPEVWDAAKKVFQGGKS